MIIRRGLPSPLAAASSALLWAGALGCATAHGPHDLRPTSTRDHRDPSSARAIAPIRRLIDAGHYPAAESAAAGRIALAPAAATDAAHVADLLDLRVEAMVLGGRGWEPGAIEAIERSLAIRRLAPGPDSLDLAGSLVTLGDLRSARWDHRGAIEAYQHSLRLRERSLGPAHAEVLASLRRIGMERLQIDDYQGADSVLRRSAAIAGRMFPLDDPARIDGDHALALLAELLGSTDTTRYASVVARSERVYGPEHPRLVEPLTRYSELMRSLGQFARAHQLMVRAHGICERALGRRNLRTAKAWNLIGVNHHWSGRTDLALPYFEESFATIRDLLGPEHVEMCKPYQDLGYCHGTVDYSVAGIPLLEHALEIADRHLPETHWLAALALYHLGGAYLDFGLADRARPLLERLLAIRVRTSAPGTMEIARAMDILGRATPDAIRRRELYEGAAHIYLNRYGADHLLGGRALSLLSICRFHEGDLTRAIGLRDSSNAVLRRTTGPQSFQVAWGLHTLGLYYLADRRPQDAARLFDSAAVAFEKTVGPEHPHTAMSLRELAEGLVAAGRPREAFAAASQAEATRRKTLRQNTRFAPESNAMGLLGDYALARARGLNLMLALAAGPLSDDLDVRRQTWDALIRSRAVILDELGARHRGWAAGADPEVEPLVARFDSTSRRLSNLEMRGLDPARAEESRGRIERARRERDRAERALAEHSTGFREARARQDLGFESLAALLPRGTSLVAYARYAVETWRDLRLVHMPLYLAFVLGGEGPPVVVPLGDGGRIDSLVTSWRRELEWGQVQRAGGRAAERRYRRTAARLREAIWDPVAAHLRHARRVFVVPDGELGLVNLSALPVGSSAYLVERDPAIHYLTAERDLATAPEPARPGAGLLAMGAPAFDASPALTADPAAVPAPAVAGYRGPSAGCVAFEEIRFGPLPASGGELEAIGDLWRQLPSRPSSRPQAGGAPVELVTGSLATETEFRRRAPGHRVVHVATHGFFVAGRCSDPDEDTRGIGGMVPGIAAAAPPRPAVNPLQLSGLAMAGANLRAQALPDQDDGILTAEEIAAVDLTGVQWAVLSACETGLGERRLGEGVTGFRRAFLIAGARTAIMSLWRIRDRDVSRWMRTLYESYWGRGLAMAESVRAASLAELRSRRAAGLATHPAHWGAFIAVGDWR